MKGQITFVVGWPFVKPLVQMRFRLRCLGCDAEIDACLPAMEEASLLELRCSCGSHAGFRVLPLQMLEVPTIQPQRYRVEWLT